MRIQERTEVAISSESSRITVLYKKNTHLHLKTVLKLYGSQSSAIILHNFIFSLRGFSRNLLTMCLLNLHFNNIIVGVGMINPIERQTELNRIQRLFCNKIQVMQFIQCSRNITDIVHLIHKIRLGYYFI